MKRGWKIAFLGLGWVAMRYVRVAGQKRGDNERRTEFLTRQTDPYLRHLCDDFDTATGSVPDRRAS